MMSSIGVSMVSISMSKHISSEVGRQSAHYQPTIWGDQVFTRNMEFMDHKIQQQYDGLKDEIRRMITKSANKPSQKIQLIDVVQHLGVSYHFENEIENALVKLSHHNFSTSSDKTDFYTTTLWFRLLRQHGFHVSCEVFEKYKDDKGNFKKLLTHDVPGMLSLYEASHLGIHGEDILDEALAFSTKNLRSVLAVDDPNSQLAKRIKHALIHPIRKCVPRLEARHFIDVYSSEVSRSVMLSKFAKLDFNILQDLHRKELIEIKEWWKSLDVATKFPYARDRIVECYFWILGVYYEPQYSLGRKILTKLIAYASILDDTYDNYGTFEELKLLTQAIQRWDISVIDILPDTMKMVYRLLLDTYNEFEDDLAKEGSSTYCLYYAKEAMKRVARSYLDEAKWSNEEYVPNMEEYLKVSLISCCYPMLITTSFVGMDAGIANKEAFEWVSKDPQIVKASSTICRLMDDIVSHEFEQQREHVASSVECYMKQYGVSEEESIKLLRKEIENGWKDINKECLRPTPVAMPLLERVLNFARATDFIYKEDDSYTNSHLLKHHVDSLLQNPIA